MAGLAQLAIAQHHPAEVPQGLAALILAVARHEGGVEVGGAGAVDAETAALPLAALEAMVHVAKHHQRQRPQAADAIDRQS